jgi:hypothetical protein
MPTVTPSMQNTILAILEEAKRQGVRRVSKTALVKWVYLVDCLHAEESRGQTASGAHWYFHHYGPFSVDVVGALDVLSARSMVQSSTDGAIGKESTIYWLSEYPVGPDLTALGLSSSLASRFSSLFKKYAGDLSQLLDYVYFKTAPMRDAQPGRKLDFQILADEVQRSSHRHTHVKDHAKMLRMLQLSETLKRRYEQQSATPKALAAHRPIYDGAFARAMEEADAESGSLDLPVTFEAVLS